MGRLVKIILFLTLFLTFSLNAFAFVSTHKEKSGTFGKEKTMQQKIQKEKRKSKGKRKTKSNEEGERISLQKAVEKIKNESKNSNAHVSITNIQLFSDIIIEKEKELEGNEGKNNIYTQCKIFSEPKVMHDFGINFEQNGWINTTEMEYFEQAAKNAKKLVGLVSPEDILKIRKYILCAYIYSVMIKEATLQLLNDFGDLKIISLKEIEKLAKESLKIAEKNIYKKDSILNKKVKIANLILKKTRCRFAGELHKIQCGNFVLVVDVPPILVKSGIIIFSKDNAGNINSNFTISKNFSLAKALKIIKQTDKYKNIAKRVERYCEKLKTMGKSYEATKIKKKAIQMMMSNKNDVDVMRVLQIPQ